MVNGSPSFCVKKASVLSISPGKSLALHPTVPLNHTLILTNTRTLTVALSQEEKRAMSHLMTEKKFTFEIQYKNRLFHSGTHVP